MLSRGDKVKDYEIVAPIRSGGMAMLYLARRRGVGGFSRLVALKLVHPHLTKDASINRLFLQEARIAATVAHPNVVHVEEVGKVDGKYFIAMEYVHGVSLAELLASLTKRRLRMSAKLCVWVAAQVSEALHAVHEATEENGDPLNIVHRDVSPQNILVGHTGHIKLIDFGIAKSQLMSHFTGGSRSVLGKLGYMGPEQLRMQPASRRTDVYALGVIVWEMLASRSLLRCARIDDERDWATREVPPPPSKHASHLTPAIDQAVLRAIAYEPAARYESALAFRAALLRAEPSASSVDAPAFAALMRNVLGDELERRRADWPSEVNVQLDSAAESTTGQPLGLEELTSRLKGSDPPARTDADEEGEEEECDEPTLKESPNALRGDREDDETVVRRPTITGERPWPSAASVEARIDTVESPASTARPLERVERMLRSSLARGAARFHEQAPRARIAAGVALALCISLAAYAAPRLYRQVVPSQHTSSSALERGSAQVARPLLPAAAVGGHTGALARRGADASLPLRLSTTHIVSTSQAEGVKQRPGSFVSSAVRLREEPRASTQVPKRTLGARAKARPKGKTAAAYRTRKPRRTW